MGKDPNEEFPLHERLNSTRSRTSSPYGSSVQLNNAIIPENNLSSHELTQRLIKDNKLRKSTQANIRPGPLRKGAYSSNLQTERDLKAMSVASLYDCEADTDTKEMDTTTENNFLLLKPDERKVLLFDSMEEFELKSIQDDNEDNDNIQTEDEFPRSYSNLNNKSNGVPENPFPDSCNLSKTLFFDDGVRSIDFVLVWKTNIDTAIEQSKTEKRNVFIENLKNEGLDLEFATVQDDLNFVKIHAPLEVLRRYSEILKLRMPMREIPGMQTVISKKDNILDQFRGLTRRIFEYILIDEKNFPVQSHRFTAVYCRDKEYLFDIKEPCFFTGTIRSRIVQFILDRKRFSHNSVDDYAFGIQRLITEEAYLAAYPLHDGEINTPNSMRCKLNNEWAAVSKWYRYQPLDYIKEYFGVKIGLYFAWLGFYTYMLLLASVVGVACFVYSMLTLSSNKPSNDICNKDLNITMCPLCDHWCGYWNLSETCFHAKITYLFDNPTTVFFAVFMSFWATLFLELWKRYSAEITHRWDLTGFDIHEEHPRPEYLARLSHVQRKRVNVITHQVEPEVPFWRMKLPATIFSFSIVILLVLLAVVAVLGVVLYRISVLAALTAYNEEVTTSTAILFTTATAATINLCLIVVFNWLYQNLAEYLTEFELLRTQTEFDDSLTLKIYLLQFVNYYASIFYIAFFKGKFVGYPGNFVRFFEFRQEECGLGGCLMELCIQLAIIMIGKQALNTIIEMIMPIAERWYQSYYIKKGKERGSFAKGQQRWLRDLKLVEWGPRSLFPEYLEMVLQYGFVTIFVAAFPLAPFFALLNNILEMRLDAKKLLTHHRRPVSQRVRDIGVWYRILDSIGKLSVITNGFIIAFTSDFIPRIVYSSVHANGTLENYLNYSLAYFNTKHWQNGSAPHNADPAVLECRYPDFREPYWSKTPYARTTEYWHILAARLAFVVVFENFVALVMIVVRWCIPDMPQDLRDQIRREAYITNEIIIKQEALRASGVRRGLSIEEPNASFVKIEKLMSASLSGSQLDLVLHGPDNPFAPGHCKPNQYNKDTQSFLDIETGRKEKPIKENDIEPVSL